MKTFLNQAINKASRERNIKKSRSLGPFASVLGQILETASQNRDLVNKILPSQPVTLFRGLTLTKTDIQDFIDIFKKKHNRDRSLQLFGFISTSFDPQIALSYTFSGICEEAKVFRKPSNPSLTQQLCEFLTPSLTEVS